MSKNPMAIRRALISVSNKDYIEDLAKEFAGHGIEILSTGGTAKALTKAGVSYKPVEEFTGNPEAFDGRMKTISFQLESAILFDRSNPKHVEQAKDLKVEPIDCVVCNFYPFQEAVAKGKTGSDLIDQIDIGGPTMVRAAAKNYQSVLVITDPEDYKRIIKEMQRLGGAISEETRKEMMVKAFELAMHYDQAIYEAFAKRELRYGENPHQFGYFVPTSNPSGVNWTTVDGQGAELSYNNFLDAQAAYGSVRDTRSLFGASVGAVSIIKHNNPCGLATGTTICDAFERAWAGDPVSSFGSVIAFSSQLTHECARLLAERFVEVVMAPDFEDGVVDVLRQKRKKIRILKINFDENASKNSDLLKRQQANVEGGYLVQQLDENAKEEFKTVTKQKFPKKLETLGRFGIVAAKWIKSNAIAIVQTHEDGGVQLVGMGSGQPNRVDAIRRLAVPKSLEVLKSESKLSECVLISDAFFPFPDNIEEAHGAGLRYIVQPGGSIKDKDVIEACDKLGVAMALTGKRHFRH